MDWKNENRLKRFQWRVYSSCSDSCKSHRTLNCGKCQTNLEKQIHTNMNNISTYINMIYMWNPHITPICQIERTSSSARPLHTVKKIQNVKYYRKLKKINLFNYLVLLLQFQAWWLNLLCFGWVQKRYKTIKWLIETKWIEQPP